MVKSQNVPLDKSKKKLARYENAQSVKIVNYTEITRFVIYCTVLFVRRSRRHRIIMDALYIYLSNFMGKCINLWNCILYSRLFPLVPYVRPQWEALFKNLPKKTYFFKLTTYL